MTPTTDLIGTAEAAVILGWSRAKVKMAAQDGSLPFAIKAPGQTGAYMFDRQTIEDVAQDKSRCSQSSPGQGTSDLDGDAA